MDYKAKETFFDGILFRSKNEAKWAAFFKAMNIKFNYEPIVVGEYPLLYKPDFYFPDYDKYAEVKSNAEGIRNEYMAFKLNRMID